MFSFPHVFILAWFHFRMFSFPHVFVITRVHSRMVVISTCFHFQVFFICFHVDTCSCPHVFNCECFHVCIAFLFLLTTTLVFSCCDYFRAVVLGRHDPQNRKHFALKFYRYIDKRFLLNRFLAQRTRLSVPMWWWAFVWSSFA